MSNAYDDLERAVDALKRESSLTPRPQYIYMSREMYDRMKNLPEPNRLEKFMAWLQRNAPYPIHKLGFWLEDIYIAWWEFRAQHGWTKEAKK